MRVFPKVLMKQSDKEKSQLAAATAQFSQLLEKEYILTLRMHRGELKEFSQFVKDD